MCIHKTVGKTRGIQIRRSNTDEGKQLIRLATNYGKLVGTHTDYGCVQILQSANEPGPGACWCFSLLQFKEIRFLIAPGPGLAPVWGTFWDSSVRPLEAARSCRLHPEWHLFIQHAWHSL